MGFGNKVLFPSSQSPSPDKYNIVRTFDGKNKTGPTFGLGRSVKIFLFRKLRQARHQYFKPEMHLVQVNILQSYKFIKDPHQLEVDYLIIILTKE